MKTLNAQEAAEFLKIHHTTLCARARAGSLPGTKVGVGWVFIAADLLQYLRAGYRHKTDNEGTAWGSTSKPEVATGPTGSSSEAKKLERALAPAPRKPRR